ncbi:MAG: hypothetical protein HWQ23_11310 [Nostoc sp. JL33]|uniref:hypothetical protein n=1 Tax=Nostoc sp. JL33 TaxID=2815396 RepID=UPI0025CBC284|nr:hypothetical protein [Nostoc sp. JL33]MBN3870831.1 hypothetical protein [Nostoc sp. JL33]
MQKSSLFLFSLCSLRLEWFVSLDNLFLESPLTAETIARITAFKRTRRASLERKAQERSPCRTFALPLKSSR